MRLNNKYAIHVLVMFYEIEMFKEWVKGIENMIQDVENPENIILHIDYSLRQDFEQIDEDALPEEGYLIEEFHNQMDILINMGVTWHDVIHRNMYKDDEPLSIARARREFNYEYADKVDLLMWGETDSFFPKETFQVLEQLSGNLTSQNIYRYVVSFAYRKMWDKSWAMLEHPEYMQLDYEDNDEWIMNNIASEKCTMTIEQMNKLNEKYTKDGFDIMQFDQPLFDGSCVVFASDLIRSGVNIPQALLMSGEDTALGFMAKTIMGNGYIQFHVRNLLRVHNRRFELKRLYIKDEDNPHGGCGKDDKGMWWKVMETMSKENLYNLGNPKFKFNTWKDYFTSVIQQGFFKEK